MNRVLVPISRAVELAGVSRRTIYNWLNAGKLEWVRTAGGSIRIYADTLWRNPGGRTIVESEKPIRTRVNQVHQVPNVDELYDDKTGGPGAYLTTTAGGRKGFLINCPQCGETSSSGPGHTVEDENPLTVSPSFVCPHKPCTAHYFVKGGQIQWV